MIIVNKLMEQVLDRLQGIRLQPKTILLIFAEDSLCSPLQKLYPKASIKTIAINNLKKEISAYDLVISVGDITFAKEPLELLLAMLKLVTNDRGLLMFSAFGVGSKDSQGQVLWRGLYDIHDWGDAMTKNQWGHPVLDVLSVDVASIKWIKGLHQVWPVSDEKKDIHLEIIFGLGWKESKDEVGISVSEVRSSRVNNEDKD